MTFLATTLSTIFASPFSLLAFAMGSLLLYVALVILYRLTIHPLAKYPGPFLAKITDVYMAYHAWKGDRHLEFWRGHEKYGSFVRLGPNLLSVNTNTALKTIYGFKANVRKSDFYTAFPANKNTFNVHSSIDKAAHARKRRVLSHAFSDAAMKSMEKFVVDKIRIFCGVLGKESKDHVIKFAGQGQEKGEGKGWSEPKNMALLSDYLAFDVMGELAFGKSFDMIESSRNRFASQLVGMAAHRHLICGTHLTIHNYHLDKIFFRKIAASRAQYMAYSRSQVMERTKLGLDVDRKDFFYYLLHAKDPETGKGFSKDELWGESNLLIIAGSDTTSTALASAFFYLVHNSHVLETLIKEIRETFEDVEEIVHGAKLSSCHFLKACIDEAMRMSPPVGGGLPRRVLPGGITIDGHDIPANVDVCVPHYTLHHNPSYYPDPFTYDSNRWLEEKTPKHQVDVAHSAFCPFSVGPRGCIGKGLAYVELTTTLARVLYLYDMKLAEGMDVVGAGGGEAEFGRHRRGEYQLKDTFTSMKDGPMVEFRSRF
ncbi:benzoate 4-monooxygenase cytochrome-like protein P450 [Tothia fuscella]|uniref:Benzoate 4-monooxygenase cytochrome-like protein P450 n=1 Tax=Tothia fuscella TaxID=1048955 RepID=A0A9P4TYM8_9PEZI|nr:benzoate 4-monooxygenase cytochrome-like protein P450 [Tothia fuscella]